ncbi:MAG: glucosamine inositolphosphorylceramide transferase family protein [Methyloceanibacter sp.]|uniref:glucosamine inositolphosphorylceramide transferase family protein n=1 Tax=Methyloceanibacter sp. TaxID=1965321 RepID=UPI003D6CB44F
MIATSIAMPNRETQGAPTPEPLTVLFVLDRSCVWRWQAWLAKAFADDGCTVAVQFAETRQGLPSALRLLMALEGLLFAAPSERASEHLGDAEIAALPVADAGAHCDLAIDFTGAAANIDADRMLRPAFDGIAGDAGAIAAVLERRSPRLGLAGDDEGLSEQGSCALEDPEIFSRGLDGVFSRMADLLLNAARGREPAGCAGSKVTPPPTTSSAIAPAAFFATSIANKASARIARLLGEAPRWQVAWRHGGSAHAHDTLDIAWRDFTRLPDDAARYYADPFVLMRGNIAHVFCEEVPFATGKGVISHFTIDTAGRASTPRPVLERPYHLSYPFVFERDGHVWMIPETSANRTVELYRAERFPDRWVKEAVLLDRVLADDATLVEHGGRLWMFAGVRDWQASSWEALGLFHADTLFGPWHAHPGNPVLLDPAASRPAGALFMHQGRLIRPAQDCRARYGAGLAFARIDRLDEEGFAQEVVARTAPETRGTKGLHTYNCASEVEVIDLFATG